MACNATIHDCSWLMNGNQKCRVNGKPYKQCKKDYPEMHGGKKMERTPTGGEATCHTPDRDCHYLNCVCEKDGECEFKAKPAGPEIPNSCDDCSFSDYLCFVSGKKDHPSYCERGSNKCIRRLKRNYTGGEDKYATALSVYREFGKKTEFELSDMFQQFCISKGGK